MKKKILFVMESLRIGGAEKSLLTLLSILDKEKYDIDLVLFRHSGEFMDQLPDGVSLLPVDENMVIMSDFKRAFLRFLKRGDLARSYYSFCWLFECFVSKYILRKPEYYGWRHLTKIYSDISGEYDVAIGYLEKKSTYFSVDKVKAKKHIAFMHTDYDAIPHDKKLDEKYYRKIDDLVVVSEHTGETMQKHFPFLMGRIHVIKNMVSPDVIIKMADNPAPEMTGKKDIIKITTVGRLTAPKNYDTAIKILKAIRDKGYDAEWFAVGEGEERPALEKRIQECGLCGKFHLLGSKSNPYPYIKNCDIYVQPSRWEGYGITVAEAKCLCMPIVANGIPEFREQIDDTVTGLIACDNDDMVNKIIVLADDFILRDFLSDNLKKEQSRINLNEIEKFKELVEK